MTNFRSPRVLIVAEPQDHTAYVMAFLLEKKGVQVEFFMPSLIPYYDQQTTYVGDGWSFSTEGQMILGPDVVYDTVWLRRTAGDSVKEFEIHEDDRPYIEQIHKAHRKSILSMIDVMCKKAGSLMVNDFPAKMIGNSKHLQLIIAEQLGLQIPQTLITNSPEQVEHFREKARGRLICKSLLPHTWKGEQSSWHAYSAIFPPRSSHTDEAVRLQPAIFQQYIEKKYEARVTIFGEKQFGIAIESQGHEKAIIDWRMSGLSGVKCSPYELSPSLFEKCLHLMAELKLTYGAFDFIITPGDEVVFLEVNESGQFLFLENKCPEVPITDAFCHFLAWGTLSDWDASSAQNLFPDVLSDPEYQKYIDQFKFFPSPDLGFVTDIGERVPALSA